MLLTHFPGHFFIQNFLSISYFCSIPALSRICQSSAAVFAAEGLTDCILAAVCTGAVNIDLVGCTFAVFIVGTAFSLTVHMDTAASTAAGYRIDRRTFRSVTKAVAAGLIGNSRIPATDADISAGAELILIVDTVGYHTV